MYSGMVSWVLVWQQQKQAGTELAIHSHSFDEQSLLLGRSFWLELVLALISEKLNKYKLSSSANYLTLNFIFSPVILHLCLSLWIIL